MDDDEFDEMPLQPGDYCERLQSVRRVGWRVSVQPG